MRRPSSGLWGGIYGWRDSLSIQRTTMQETKTYLSTQLHTLYAEDTHCKETKLIVLFLRESEMTAEVKLDVNATQVVSP